MAWAVALALAGRQVLVRSKGRSEGNQRGPAGPKASGECSRQLASATARHVTILNLLRQVKLVPFVVQPYEVRLGRLGGLDVSTHHKEP